MFSELARLAALMASFLLLHVGHGGLAALVVQQGSKYEFSDSFLGLLTSVTYVGFFAGSYLMRYLLPRISYIRTFSVCAAVLAVWVLFMPLFPNEAGWVVLRLLYGVFFSTIIVICDGWMNSAANNQNRSRIYAANMTLAYVGLGVSQYILILGETLGTATFSIVSMVIILSLVPVCLTRFPEPQVAVPKKENAAPLTFAAAYRVAPVSFVGQFVVGMTTGASWLFVRYAEGVTDSPEAVSLLAMLFFVSGVVLQLPVGWISDRAKDRRAVMGVVYFASALFSLLMFFGEHLSSGILAVLIFVYGAVSVTAYSLNVSYGQDFIESNRSAEYAGRLFQMFSIGALLGPLMAGYLMDVWSLSWLFGFCAVVFAFACMAVVTDRLMPRYIPANPDSYQMLSPHMPPAIDNPPEYTELEVGPVLPDDVAERDDEEELVGPAPPEELPDSDFTGPPTPDEELPEADFTGPPIPDEAWNDDVR